MEGYKVEIAKTRGGTPLTGAALTRYVQERLEEQNTGRISLDCEYESWAALDRLDKDMKECIQRLIESGEVFTISSWVNQKYGEIQDRHTACFIIEREVLNGDIKVEVIQYSPDSILLNQILHELYPQKADFMKAFHLKEDVEVQLLKDGIYTLYWELRQKNGFSDQEKRTELFAGDTYIELIIKKVICLNEETVKALFEAHANDVKELITSQDFLGKINSQLKAGSVEDLAAKLMERAEQCCGNEFYDSALFYYSQAISFLEKLQAEGKTNQSLEEYYADALLSRCALFLSLDMKEEALSDCNRMIHILHTNLNPRREYSLVMALTDRAFLKNALALYEEALDDYSRAIDILIKLVEGGIHDDGLLSSLFLCRGKLYLKMAQPDLARQDLENVEKFKQPQAKLTDLFAAEVEKLGILDTSRLIDTSKFPRAVLRELQRLYQLTNSHGRGSINIFAEKGDKVLYVGTARGGSKEDKETAAKYLKEGEIYTVYSTYVSDSLSFVMLDEYPDILYSMLFFIQSVH